jgi:DNA primase
MGVAADEIVLLVESESSADALMRAGWYATTWPGGAADPPVDQIRNMLGRHDRAVLIPDHDDAGLACRDRIVGSGAIPRVLLGERGEDARDLHKRLGPDRFRAAVSAALRGANPTDWRST